MDQPRVRKTWIIGGWLACCCCWAVPAVGQEGSDAWGAEIERWQHQLADPAPTYRVQAAAKLGRFGSDAAAAVDDLIAALEDSHPEVRMQAIVALVQIDARPLEVAQRLIACIGDPDEHVDYAAQWGLAHLSESLVRDHWNAAAELSVAEKVLSRAVDRCADSGGHPGQAARIGQQLHACRTRLVQLQTQQMRHQQIARARKHLRQIVEWMSAGRTLDHFRAIEELSPARLERNSWDDALDSDAVLRARIDILLALRNRHDPTMDRFLVKRWGAAFHDVAWMAMREALREDSASEVAEWLLWEIPIESDDDWREVLNLVGQADSHRIRRAAVAALERTAVRRGATILRLAEILADSGADAPSPSPARSEGGVAIPWLRSQEDTGAALQYPALDSLLGLLERAGPGELAAPVQRRVWEILLGVRRPCGAARHARFRCCAPTRWKPSKDTWRWPRNGLRKTMNWQTLYGPSSDLTVREWPMR